MIYFESLSYLISETISNKPALTETIFKINLKIILRVAFDRKGTELLDEEKDHKKPKNYF